MTAPNTIVELVEKFRQGTTQYTHKDYNETQVRVEFVNPLFEALGWDVRNSAQVTHEDRVIVTEDGKRKPKHPDYGFRIGKTTHFYVETKKPALNLKDDPSPAYQVRRYGWSGNLPVSILTDFEEFIIYDCRIQPDKNDPASKGRLRYYKYSEYVDKWTEIESIFSFEAVRDGALTAWIEDEKTRGALSVDEAFLREMEGWRETLAKDIALHNRDLTRRQLNLLVQRTIDRLVFLRIAEDRNIEAYGRLQRASGLGKRVYDELKILFKEADDKYNSGLFHFDPQDKERGIPDTVAMESTISDDPLRNIISNLYYPNSPYEFSVLPADILGQVYERFLGKVIELSAGGQATIEEKPEVRKAGGVYYTPTYIVDYIVQNTVGKLIEGKTPAEVAKLTVLDPACGSGSFLIGAYQVLMDWHLDYYRKRIAENPNSTFKNRVRLIPDDPAGGTTLTTDEKRRILLNNIYGVDLDQSAVEVTKLSLLLKMLENETGTTAEQYTMFSAGERILPDLSHNIKWGNSLIGSDFYSGKQMGMFDDEAMYKVKAFDWDSKSKGFGDIMAGGGFDAVIGNPPYGFHQIHADEFKPYFKKKLKASKGSFEHYFLFYEQSLSLLKDKGKHGFIVPVTWLTIPSALSLRKVILDNYSVIEINWLPELVFKNAQVNTLISIISKSPKSNVIAKVYDELGFTKPPKEVRDYEQQHFIDAEYNISIFQSKDDYAIITKMKTHSEQLQTMARPCSGYNPYEVGKGIAPDGNKHTKETVKSKPYHSDRKIDKAWKPEIIGRNLKRFHVTFTGERWIKYGEWLAAPRDSENFLGKRILVQEITGGADKRVVAAFYDGELYHSRDVIPIKIENTNPHHHYLLGIINSRLISWYHRKSNPKAQKGLFPKVLVSDLKKLPIRTIDFDNPDDVKQHDNMVRLVETMLDLHKQLPALDGIQREMVESQIEATDGQIDRLVYALYKLTEDEIKIVEN